MKKTITQQLIEKHGMTVEEIAVAVKASASAVRGWRHGKAPRAVYHGALNKLLKEKGAA